MELKERKMRVFQTVRLGPVPTSHPQPRARNPAATGFWRARRARNRMYLFAKIRAEGAQC
jgi:hypothetical protein